MGQDHPIADKTILIVEDEALIRINLIDFFEDAGYHVFEAQNAEEAILILEADSTIQVVLTDVQMPGLMDGLRLAHYVRERFPPTVLVVASAVLQPTPDEMPANSFFVPKPFDLKGILRRIEHAMG